MSRTSAIIKREFVETVRTRMFLIGTILGPILMVGLFGAQFLMMASAGGGHVRLAIVDETGDGLGEAVAAMLETGARLPGARPGARAEYDTEIAASVDATADYDALVARVEAREIDGFLVLPAGLLDGGAARYEGRNATNSAVLGDLRGSVQRVVQGRRLTVAGIDPAELEGALRPVTVEAVRTGGRGARGSAAGALLLGFAMGFAIYLVVALYGAAVMNGVIEEKRDRIVELIVSSVRPQSLMLGKVVGIGGAGLLQMTIWVVVAGALLVKGGDIATTLGASERVVAALSQRALLPEIPLSVGLVFLLYFAGGFFIYSTVYATLGAIATTSQEAQQLVFPALLPLMLGIFMLMPTLERPEGTLAIVGSFIPLTSPMLMPARHALIGVPAYELAASVVLLVLCGLGIIWLGGKIYRIGIFATGKRATAAEVWRWIRTA